MSKITLSSFMLLCAALAACSNDDARRSLLAPDAAASFDEIAADLGGAYSLDGSASDAFATQDAFASMAGAQTLGAQVAASTRAASGNRSSGHVGFPAGVLPTGTGIASEKYSYVALRTDPATPDAAKGQVEIMYTTTTGMDVRVMADVICMNVFGNNARVGAQITKVWRNNVPSPITANTHAFWVVVDNGEGNPSPDLVSLMRFGNAATAQTYCSTGFLSFVFPNQEGNIQVRN